MLSGIRVVELGNFITGPLAAMMLADLGADVIKVERPEGDPFRRAFGQDYGPAFTAYNRNKKSVVLDTAKPDDREALARLVASADVLIDNMRPAALEKLGLGEPALGEKNPRLIHCSITGFGNTGPYQNRPAFDGVGQAISGISSFLVDPDRPESFGPTIPDNCTGMYAAYAVLGALVERGRTGRGRRLEINMLESSMAFIQDGYTTYMQSGILGGRLTRIARSQAFTFRCADGKLLGTHLSTGEKFWQELAKACGAEALIVDDRFRTHQLRVKNYEALRQLLSEKFLARPRAEWMAILDAADVPMAPVHNVADALEDPQVKALGTVLEVEHPQRGRVRMIDCPVLADGARPVPNPAPPPDLGEHTQSVLAELGLARK
jgi:crotonobetainyl-CoA:carnitine CoA-transferase CaiB-like acyl-CoA transferase